MEGEDDPFSICDVVPRERWLILVWTQIFTPILHWIDGKAGPAPKPVPYPYGSRGPKELDSFISKYGFKRTVAE